MKDQCQRGERARRDRGAADPQIESAIAAIGRQYRPNHRVERGVLAAIAQHELVSGGKRLQLGAQLIGEIRDRRGPPASHADQALQAALQMRERVADLPPVAGIKLAVRAGLAHGTVDEENGSPVGEAADAAMQLARQANQRAASAAAKVLRNPNSSKAAKTAAASALTQRPNKK